MNSTLILMFNEGFMSYEEAKHFLNAREDVSEWAHIFDGFFILVSSNDAEPLGDALLNYVKRNQGKEKPIGRFLLMASSSDRQGWLPSVAWNLLKYQTTKKPETEIDLDDEIPF